MYLYYFIKAIDEHVADLFRQLLVWCIERKSILLRQCLEKRMRVALRVLGILPADDLHTAFIE